MVNQNSLSPTEELMGAADPNVRNLITNRSQATHSAFVETPDTEAPVDAWQRYAAPEPARLLPFQAKAIDQQAGQVAIKAVQVGSPRED